MVILDLINALRNIIDEKLNHYSLSQGRETRLVLYYDQGVLYNTPYNDFLKHETFVDVARTAAQLVREVLARRSSPFTKIYLLKALWPKPQAFEIWPTLTACG